METANGSPPDALQLLRSSIASNTLPIPTVDADASTTADADVSLAVSSYLTFNITSPDGSQHLAIPLDQPTRFVSAAAGRPLDLRSVYFCWLNKDTGVGDYIAATQALNDELSAKGRSETVTNLVFAEKLDLVTWLAGDVGEEDSEFITSLDSNKQVRRQANDAAVTAKGGEDVEMRDAELTDGAAQKREQERLREIYAAERKMGDRNTVLRGVKIQDFGDVRKKYSVLFFGKGGRAAAAAAAAAANPAAITPALTANPALRPSGKPASSGRRLEPIILLSPSASSLLRMPNIKRFLEEGVYEPPEMAGSSGTNILHLMRTLPTVSPTRPLRFILVDDPASFRPDYWDRLVAVFTTGQTWQFKNYKWQSPGELFSHALGIHVGWRGDDVPDTVKGWGRGVMSVNIDKGVNRWRDREVVEDVWRGIEGRMKAMGWGKDGK